MRPWGCTPGTYLIDNLLDPLRRDRHWLVDHLAYLAQVTRERGPDVEQDDITLRWNVWMIAPGGIRVRVRILVDRRDDRIFNAFPDRYR